MVLLYIQLKFPYLYSYLIPVVLLCLFFFLGKRSRFDLFRFSHIDTMMRKTHKHHANIWRYIITHAPFPSKKSLRWTWVCTPFVVNKKKYNSLRSFSFSFLRTFLYYPNYVFVFPSIFSRILLSVFFWRCMLCFYHNTTHFPSPSLCSFLYKRLVFIDDKTNTKKYDLLVIALRCLFFVRIFHPFHIEQ